MKDQGQTVVQWQCIQCCVNKVKVEIRILICSSSGGLYVIGGTRVGLGDRYKHIKKILRNKKNPLAYFYAEKCKNE